VEEMLRLELLEITKTLVKYKYYPESSKEYGIIVVDRTSKERNIEKLLPEYGSNYPAHAFRRIEEYLANNKFQEEDIVAWY
jgi:hypothetical protein